MISRSTTSGGPYTDIVSLSTNTTSYTNSGLLSGTTYYYVVRATNAFAASAYSSQASAMTFTPPGISAQPQSLTVTQANNATFSVTATGTAPLSYQWRFFSTNLPGATASSYTRFNAQPADAGPYSVVVSNSAGTSNSATATLTVIVIPPVITLDPSSRAAVPNGFAQFNVAAVGSNVLYQWQANLTNLSGATNASLVISNVSQTDFGSYRAIATNSGGSATSAVAQLTLAISPAIITPIFSSNTFELHFNTEFGPIYAVEYKQALDDPLWIELTRTNGTGAPVTIISDAATNATQFYRLHLY